MSVLKTKRNLSKYEFEHTFAELYSYTTAKTSAMPKRRKRWLCWKLDAQMNLIFNNIMEINEGRFDKESKEEVKEKILTETIYNLLKLEKPLMIIWNVEEYDIRRMVAWKKLIDNEIDVINAILSQPILIDKIQILDWRAIMNVKFLSNMSELHRLVHGKIAKAPNKYDDTYSSMVLELLDDALYSLVKANSKIPTTVNEYQKRKENISNAISCLRKIQRPLIFYFNIMNYSEKSLCEISDKICTELKLLYALNKSDKVRFSGLK